MPSRAYQSLLDGLNLLEVLMRSASIADWLLRRVASKEQAASIVGDLVEISPRKGIVWFWLAVCRCRCRAYLAACIGTGSCDLFWVLDRSKSVAGTLYLARQASATGVLGTCISGCTRCWRLPLLGNGIFRHSLWRARSICAELPCCCGRVRRADLRLVAAFCPRLLHCRLRRGCGHFDC